MEKLKKVKMILLDGTQIDVSEVMDIGQHYYLLSGQNVESVKKVNVAQISWESKVKVNDNSKYVKD